jgi:hypothetical protein
MHLSAEEIEVVTPLLSTQWLLAYIRVKQGAMPRMSLLQGHHHHWHTSECCRGSSCRPAAGDALAAGACVRVGQVTSCEAEDVVVAWVYTRVTQRVKLSPCGWGRSGRGGVRPSREDVVAMAAGQAPELSRLRGVNLMM